MRKEHQEKLGIPEEVENNLMRPNAKPTALCPMLLDRVPKRVEVGSRVHLAWSDERDPLGPE